LGVRSGLLVGFAIPSSFLLGFLMLYALGFTVNTMVMFGLVLTVGMLVDGAIVVTEYADRKMAEGMPSNEAYRRAAKLMFWPVISSTATTLAAFLPLLLWPGVTGEFMSYLPIMVIIVLSSSLLTALIFIPATGAMLGAIIDMVGALFSRNKKPRKVKQDNVASMLSSREQLNLEIIPGATGLYLRFLNALTSGLAMNILVIIAAGSIVAFTFYRFETDNKGVEFFVDEEPRVAIVFVSARGNLAAKKIRDIAIEVESQVLQVRGIENVVMTAQASGGGDDGGGVDLNAPQDMPPDVVATMQIELMDYSNRRKADEIFKDIRDRTANIAGIAIEIRKIEGGPPTGKDVRLQVKSTDYNQMVASVGKIREFFNTIEDVKDHEDSRPLPGIEWEIAVDREEAGRYNAGITSVGAMIQLVTNGVLLGKYRPDDSEDELDIRIRLPKEQRSLDQLKQLRLRTSNGQVPISNFVKLAPVDKVSSVTRKDGQYSMSVKANIVKGVKFGDRELTPKDKIEEVQAWIDKQEWPESVSLKFRGADEDETKSQEFLGKAAIGALFMMFIILLTQFNSFYQTALTLMTVILAVVGVLIGMMITGQKFSVIMTGTGVVALAGIVVNNAIVLIDTYNRLRSEGAGIHDAILKTSAQRMRPIMLTTVTTILGLIPMALTINVDFFERIISYGSITAVWWVQLSTAVISGLAFSTLLTLILIPVLLSMPANIAAVYNQTFKSSKDDRLVIEGADSDQLGESESNVLSDMAIKTQESKPPKAANTQGSQKAKTAKKRKPSRASKRKLRSRKKDFPEAAE
ncbi:MAG: efflux RND transporter permease subunit, partial [Hyphomicrobiales bacterium]|nr:efflux RND transporter permease subunit [Hyphomicrobiales bacterium]